MNGDSLHSRLANRQPGALEEFYAEHRGRIVAVARRYGRDDWDAEEIVQDVLWTVHRKAHTFAGNAAFSSWVYRVSQNAARMHIRKNKRNPTPMEAEHVDAALERTGSGADGLPDELAHALEMQRAMAKAFSELDPMNQDVFDSIEVRDRDREMVAQEMGLSIPALKSRLHRVRSHLRDAAAVA